jgi:hypothetical protein
VSKKFSPASCQTSSKSGYFEGWMLVVVVAANEYLSGGEIGLLLNKIDKLIKEDAIHVVIGFQSLLERLSSIHLRLNETFELLL